ncbi:MAG: FG-GAP repeat domain-containing protein [Candidatus Midichloria sp.]
MYYFGSGNGGFSSLTSYSVGFSLYGTATADFSKDGIQDIVTPNWGTMTVSTLLGNGDGIFKPAVFYNSGSQPSGVKAADLNSDGNQDIVSMNFGEKLQFLCCWEMAMEPFQPLFLIALVLGIMELQ